MQLRFLKVVNNFFSVISKDIANRQQFMFPEFIKILLLQNGKNVNKKNEVK